MWWRGEGVGSNKGCSEEQGTSGEEVGVQR